MKILNPDTRNRWSYHVSGRIMTNKDLVPFMRESLDNNLNVMKLHWASTPKEEQRNGDKLGIWCRYYGDSKYQPCINRIRAIISELTESKPFIKEDWL